MFRSKSTIIEAKKHLQEVNEQMYKQNLELAVKNKTLSLLRRLYEITAAHLEIQKLADELVVSIIDILKLPYVAILASDSKSKSLRLMAAASAISPKRVLDIDSGSHRARVLPVSHACVGVLRAGKRRQFYSFEGVARGCVTPADAKKIQKKFSIKTTTAFPLILGRNKVGVLVLSLGSFLKDLNRFEKESIESLVDVVSVALDRSMTYEGIKGMNAKLKELDELKTEFLSIASHQLRTPLSIIKGYGELLTDGAYGKLSRQAIEVLGNIDESNERLIKLVDEFLNVSRIEQGRTQYNFSPMNPVTMAEGVVTELKNKARTKNIELALDVEEGIDEIIGDEEKLRHCLYNFVDNAIKYSLQSSTVRVYLEKDGNRLRARVHDNGVGLDKKDLQNLFQKFYRSPHVLKDIEGTGLGLFVVRQFAEAHGGEVYAKSEGVGKGSEFGFVIPTKHSDKKKV